MASTKIYSTTGVVKQNLGEVCCRIWVRDDNSLDLSIGVKDSENWSGIQFTSSADRITGKLSVGDGKEKKIKVYS